MQKATDSDRTTFAAIVSQGRSGSTYVQHLLDSHTDITFLGELLNPGQLAAGGSTARRKGRSTTSSGIFRRS